MKNECVIRRSMAAAKIKGAMKAYVGDEAPLDKSGKPNIAMIVAPGLAGKTTFLLHDVKSLLGKRRAKEEEKKELGDYYSWVYVAFDIETSRDSRALFLYRMCTEMRRAGCSSPVMEAALKRYDQLTGNGLKKVCPDFSAKVVGYIEFVEDVSGIGERLMDLIASLVDANPDMFSSIMVDMDSMIEQLEGAIAQAPEPVFIVFGILQIAVSFAGLAQGLNKLGKKVYKARVDLNPIFKGMSHSEVEGILESAISQTIDWQDGLIRKPCIVIDGIEGLMGYDGPDDRIGWLERICIKSNAFFVLAGRRRLADIPDSRFVDIELDSLTKDEFKEMLGYPPVLSIKDSTIYRAAADLPGILSIYAAGRQRGKGGRYLNRADRKKIAEAAQVVLAGGGARRRRYPGAYRGDEDDMVTALGKAYHLKLEEKESGHLWQLVAALSWIPEWNSLDMVDALVPFAAHALYVNDIKPLAFVQEVAQDQETFRIHPVMSACFRRLCTPELKHALMGSFEDLLGNPSMRDCAIQTLLALSTALAFEDINALTAKDKSSDGLYPVGDVDSESSSLMPSGSSDGLYPVGDVDHEVTRSLFMQAASSASGWSYDSQRKRRAIRDLVEQFIRILRLLHEGSEDLRKRDPENALVTISVAEDASRLLYTEITRYLPDSDHLKAEMDIKAKEWHITILREKGAILSDHYRIKSDICFHIQALGLEIEALRIVVSLETGRWDSVLESRFSKSYIDCINSVAVSCYRLKRYDLAIPLITIAEMMVNPGTHGVQGRGRLPKAITEKVSNNYLTIRYGFICDCEDSSGRNGISWPRAWSEEQSLSNDQIEDELIPMYVPLFNELLNEGKATADRYFAPEGKKLWKQALNYAMVLLLEETTVEDSLNLCLQCEKHMKLKKRVRTEEMARCLMIQARALLKLATIQVSVDKARQLLDKAEEAALNAREIIIELHGSKHMDVVKSTSLIQQISSRRSGYERAQAPKVSEEGPGLCNNAPTILPPLAIASSIVRGDFVSLPMVFGLAMEDLEDRFEAVAENREDAAIDTLSPRLRHYSPRSFFDEKEGYGISK